MKENESTAVAVVSDETALMNLGDMTGVAERPKSLDPHDRSGTEDIGREDLRFPRLAIAQGLSTQMIPDDSTYIPELKLFDMFNDLSGEVIGRGPVTFVPIQRNVLYIEFEPRVKGQPGGGGVIDLDVPHGDDRTKWSTVDGVKQPPRATRFVEFVVLLLQPGKVPEPVVISIKETNKFNRRAAEQLTAFIKFRNAAIYAGLYQVTTKSEKNDNGTFGVYVMKNAGFIPVDTPSGAALYKFAEDRSKALEGKTIVVNREPGDEDFDAETLEAESAAAGKGADPGM